MTDRQHVKQIVLEILGEIPKRPALNTEQAAIRLNVSTRKIERMRLDGTGPRFFRVGGSVRYEEVEIERYIAEQTRSNTADAP